MSYKNKIRFKIRNELFDFRHKNYIQICVKN